MNYFLDLFSPETHEAFSASTRDVSGFRLRHKVAAGRVQAGDILVCYLTRLSRWVGLLRVLGPPFTDETPRFVAENDPFVIRFKVEPLVWLPPAQGIPIHDDSLWDALSFTKGHDKRTSTWTGAVRGSLNKLAPADGALIEQKLRAQAQTPTPYPLGTDEGRALSPTRVRRADGLVVVSVPDDAHDEIPDTTAPVPTVRESYKIQALLASIGAQMGFRIWLPNPDRGSVLREWPGEHESLLAQLPLNYDDTTLRTIERIDVLWLKGRSIARAFEVEHTTAIYSGILRMADLLALQPNMDIRLHIVAPEARREKVFDEIRRPVFSLLERRPLAECCTLLSYDSIRGIAELPHLGHLQDSVLEEYEEEAE
jgi:hypothetical protein